MTKNFEDNTREFYQNYFESFNYAGDPRESFSEFSAEYQGSFGKPGTRASVEKRVGDQLLFKAEYSFDEFGRRKNPLPASSENNSFALFVGGTLIYGEGVDDEDTLPACFQKIADYHGYNYSFLGMSPQNFLRKCENGFAPGEVAEKTGKVFCFYRDDCISLVRGKTPWVTGFPRYEISSNGKLVRRGVFEASSQKSSVYLVSDYTEEDYRTTAKLYASIREKLSLLFPESELIVILEPVTFSAPQMAKYLKEEKLRFIDLACVDLDYLSWPTSRSFDMSLTPEGNRTLAKLLKLSLEDRQFARAISQRRKSIEALTDEERNLDQAAFNGGFLFGFYENFPMDDALDLVLRCAKKAREPVTEAKREELLGFCRAGFDMKRAWMEKLRDSGILDYKFQPVSIVSERELKNILNADTPKLLLRVFHETYFLDYDRVSSM